jgi:hypothetical protein
MSRSFNDAKVPTEVRIFNNWFDFNPKAEIVDLSPNRTPVDFSTGFDALLDAWRARPLRLYRAQRLTMAGVIYVDLLSNVPSRRQPESGTAHNILIGATNEDDRAVVVVYNSVQRLSSGMPWLPRMDHKESVAEASSKNVLIGFPAAGEQMTRTVLMADRFWLGPPTAISIPVRAVELLYCPK